MGDLRAEIWARPGASTFAKIYADALTERLSGTDRANGIGDGSFEFPDFDDAETLADLLLRVDDASLATAKRALVRVYHRDQSYPPVHEWLVDAVVPPGVDNNPRWQVSGSGPLGWLDNASVYPWDWDGTTAFVSAFPDHIWGGRNVLGELRCSFQPEVVTLTANDAVDDGTFTISVSTAIDDDTTAAIDYDATALAVYNALLATTTIDALEVDGAAGGPWTVTLLEPAFPFALSTNNAGLAGTWALALGGATGGTFTLTFEGQTTGALNWDDDAATIEAAIEALSNVTAATVSGSAGSFTISFETPDSMATASITDSTTGGSGATLTENEAAIVAAVQTNSQSLPAGWISSEFSPTDMEHGTLQSFRCWRDDGFDPALPACADTAIAWNGREPFFPGIEKTVRVQPGGIYQASVWVYARDDDTDIRLVLRDFADNQATAPGDTNYFVEQTVTADTWTQLTITDFVPADDVDEVKFRIGHVGADGVDPPIIYVACPELTEGQAPTSIGGVWISLWDDATSDHTGDGRLVWEDEANPGTPYITCDFTAAVDSAGVAWDTTDVEITAKRGWSYGRVLKETLNLDYEARIVPDPVTDGAWLFQLFNPGGMDDDYSGDSFVGVRTGVDVVRRQTKRFRPGGTAQTVEGADRQFAFDVNTTAETALGRMEQYLPDRDLNGPTEIATAAATLLAEGLKRAISKTLTVQPGPDDPVPLVDYVPGDTIPVVDPPDADTDLRVAAINYVVAPDIGARYEVSMASERAVGQAAIRAGVIQYLREQKEIREEPPDDGGGGAVAARALSHVDCETCLQFGGVPQLDPDAWIVTGDGTSEPTNVSIATGRPGDIMVMAVHAQTTGGTPGKTVDTPAGFTLLQWYWGGSGQEIQTFWFGKIATGAESGSITMSYQPANQFSVVATNRVISNGATLSLDDISFASTSEDQSGTSDLNPPPITLAGASQYAVIAGILYQKFDGVGIDGYPDDYTNVVDVSPGTNRPSMNLAQRLIEFDGTEDPTTFSTSAGSPLRRTRYTLAVDLTGTDPVVAEYDHDHVESDITDLAHVVTVAKAGTEIGTRSRINFIEGTDITLTVADDPGNDEIDVTVTSTAGGGGGGSGWTELASDVLASDGTISIDGISGSHTDLILRIEARSDKAGDPGDGFWLRFGDASVDSGSNYNWRSTETGGGGNADAATQLGPTSAIGAPFTAGAATAGETGAVEIEIFNYADATNFRRVHAEGYQPHDRRVFRLDGMWENAADPISKIRVNPSKGTNFVAGARWWLYGR